MKTTWIHNNNIYIYKDALVGNSLPVLPSIVLGDFNCINLEITSLINSPKEVHGTVMLYNNLLTDLIHGPTYVEKGYDCSYNKLTTLEGAPKKVKSFRCENNLLLNLIHGPEEVIHNYKCAQNKLTSLKGAPKKVKNFNCEENKLTSLNHCPEVIELICYSNEKHLYTEYCFVKEGYNNYYKDLLNFCVLKNFDLETVYSWPEGFITENVKQSVNGITKFGI